MNSVREYSQQRRTEDTYLRDLCREAKAGGHHRLVRLCREAQHSERSRERCLAIIDRLW